MVIEGMDFKNVYVREISFAGLPGSNISDAVTEVFNWFHNQKEVDRCVIVNLNGTSIVMEKKACPDR